VAALQTYWRPAAPSYEAFVTSRGDAMVTSPETQWSPERGSLARWRQVLGDAQVGNARRLRALCQTVPVIKWAEESDRQWQERECALGVQQLWILAASGLRPAELLQMLLLVLSLSSLMLSGHSLNVY
jgi:hypothetical protein